MLSWRIIFSGCLLMLFAGDMPSFVVVVLVLLGGGIYDGDETPDR